jgi:hypothetical protein
MGNTSIGQGATVAIVLAGLFLAFLPIFVAHARGRLTLEIATILLTGIAVLGAGGVVAGAAAGGMVAAMFLPGVGVCWFAALFCGLAAFMDKSQERRDNESMFRLLYNVTAGLKPPKGVKMPKLQPDNYEQFRSE